MVPERFWSKAVKSDGCWEWVGFKRAGYGRFWFEGRPVQAHQVAYMLEHGGGLPGYVMHKCDNPGCVNPEHLSASNHAENMRDRNAKGRAHSVLNEDQVKQIRASHDSAAEIARREGINYYTAYSAKSGKNWSWI